MDAEIKDKESRLSDLNNENYNLNIEGDCNKKNRDD